MPRKPRQNVVGIHHVYARGNDRRLVFRDDVDRAAYLAILAYVVRRTRWRCLAYCLMDNHVHLLVEIAEPNLPSGMQRLHGRYAHSFNTRHRRSGHVFQGRYGSIHVASDEHLWGLIAYIAHNPVKAGCCRRASDWRWGSHAAMRSGAAPPWLASDRVLELAGRAGGDPARRYAELVGD